MYNGTYFKNVFKWIMNLGATKHTTLYNAVFDTYGVITPRNVHMGDDNIIKTIEMRSIIMEDKSHEM